MMNVVNGCVFILRFVAEVADANCERASES